MMLKNLKISLLALLLVQSCCLPFFDYYSTKPTESCAGMHDELKNRYNLFKKLSKKEIKHRKKTKIKAVAKLDELSVISKIVEALDGAKAGSNLVAVDLRYYRKVEMGETIIANVSQNNLHSFLKNSKYTQGFFTVININSEFITVVPPSNSKEFDHLKIKRGDLANAEIVINVSDAKHISGNLKFSENQKVSIIADRVLEPYRLDLRESSNIQSLFNRKWVMSVYSLEGSKLKGGKKTTGYFKFINNYNSEIDIDKFKDSASGCYVDERGSKFKK